MNNNFLSLFASLDEGIEPKVNEIEADALNDEGSNRLISRNSPILTVQVVFDVFLRATVLSFAELQWCLVCGVSCTVHGCPYITPKYAC